ncbi:MAG: CoA transferase [Phyllobacteriaceae bacterium]|nr:CoA transferase [Phyllobacteriaceae bacterium]
MAGVLAGLRIVEFAGLGPAPFAAMMLADHGAEVLRICPPRPRRGIPSIDTRSDLLARGRRSIAVDLRQSEGCRLALDLIAQADGVIEGFRPGVMERLGLSPTECLSRNPSLTYGRMTGWGQSGPMAHAAGHDINYIALTGVLNAIGPRSHPVAPLNLLGDFGGGGMLLAFGMIASILNAQKTGQGQVVDAAMTDGTAILATLIHGFRTAGAWSEHRHSNLLDGGAYFYGTYRCADGKYVAVGAIEPQFHAILLDGLDLSPDDFDQTDQDRWPDMRRRIADRFLEKDCQHWIGVFEGTDACVTPILSFDEALGHHHNQERETFVAVDGCVQPAPAPRFSETPAPAVTPPELPDAAGLDVLDQWCIPRDRSQALVSDGVIGFWK